MRRIFKTKEEFKEPTTFLKKRGIEKVGNYQEIILEKQEDGSLEIAKGSCVVYYYSDRPKEITKDTSFVINFPLTLKSELLSEIEKIWEEK